jgi:hypothetical protein
MVRNFDIVKRAYDSKFVVYAEVDRHDADRDWYLKNGLAVPQMWVAVAVTDTKEAAVRATKQVKL